MRLQRQLSMGQMTRLAGFFALAGLTACQTTPQGGDSESQDMEGGETSNQQFDVTVQGAEATTVDGSTIKLEYPEAEHLNDRIPDWVINPAMGGVTGAVGVAPQNDLGIREQFDEARLNGRLELASMLEVRVQRVGRSELEQEIRFDLGSSGDRSRRNTLGVDRNILDSVLAGSRQRALWFDEKSGECYVWMVMDGNLLERADHSVIKGISIFIANQGIGTEYKPQRANLEPPTVIFSLPSQTLPAPPPEAPAPPLEPIEELEGKLKPIETIPVESKSDGSNDNS